MNIEEAIAAGSKRYLGKPCKRGHAGWRWVRDNDCCDCDAARVRQLAASRIKPQAPPRPIMALPSARQASDFIQPPTRAQLMAGR